MGKTPETKAAASSTTSSPLREILTPAPTPPAMGEPVATPHAVRLTGRLFERLAARYGQRWSAQFDRGSAEANATVAKAAVMEWAEDLGAYPAELVWQVYREVKFAFPAWPPTLGEYLALCEHVRKRERRLAEERAAQARPQIAEFTAAQQRAARERFRQHVADLRTSLRPPPAGVTSDAVAESRKRQYIAAAERERST